MPKEFYTERDIEDMVKRGVLSLEINDDVVLTDLAYEKANKLGMRLVRDRRPDNPPSAPVRPYLSQPAAPKAAPAQPAAAPPGSLLQPAPPPPGQAIQPPPGDAADLHKRIRSAVLARLGSQIDGNLLDVIITRVLKSTGIQ